MTTPSTDYAPAVLAVMRREGVGLTVSEIAEIGRIPTSAVRSTLNRLQRDGAVVRVRPYWLLERIDGSGVIS